MKESINLLPESKAFSRRLKISPRIANFFVITTAIFELLLVGLLVFRARLDGQSLILSQRLEKEKSVVVDARDQERTIETLQEKVSLIKELRNNRDSFLKAIKLIPEIIPGDVTLKNINLREPTLSLVARTESGLSFARMVDNFNRSSKFSDLTLSGSSFDDETGVYTFTFEAVTKPEVFR